MRVGDLSDLDFLLLAGSDFLDWGGLFFLVLCLFLQNCRFAPLLYVQCLSLSHSSSVSPLQVAKSIGGSSLDSLSLASSSSCFSSPLTLCEKDFSCWATFLESSLSILIVVKQYLIVTC